MPHITANPAVTPQGRSELTRAVRHAWAAGDLSDAAVREVTNQAMGLVAAYAITSSCTCGWAPRDACEDHHPPIVLGAARRQSRARHAVLRRISPDAR